MSYNSWLRACVVGAAAMLWAGSASAVTIFSDDFNRANNSSLGGSPWSELENDANDVAISSNQLLLRDELSGNPDAAAAAGTFSTVGFQNITLSLDWNDLSGTEDSDVLHIAWAVGSPSLSNEGAWTNLATVFGNGSDTYALLGADDLAAISFILWTDVGGFLSNGSGEGYLIDNVVLAGDPIVNDPPINGTPIPGALPLFATGLGVFGGFGFWRKRRARRPAA